MKRQPANELDNQVFLSTDSGRKRLLLVVSEEPSKRMGLAKFAAGRGWEVSIACSASFSTEEFMSEPIHIVNWETPRGSPNVLQILRAARSLRNHIRTFQPSVVHAISIRTSVITRIAMFGFSEISQLSTISGLGRISSARKRNQMLGSSTLKALGNWLTWSSRNSLTIQNTDDFRWFGGFKNSRIHLIHGSGVNLNDFPKTPFAKKTTFRVSLIARMLRPKGVQEFVDAIASLRSEGYSVEGVLVGGTDRRNPMSFSEEELKKLSKTEGIVWVGHQTDILKFISNSDVVCLPTYYGEGIPRVILEAGCVGRPVVSCDVPGPRDVIRDGLDGFLVAPKDVGSLASALRELLRDSSLRQAMGESLHSRVSEFFSDRVILEKYYFLYHSNIRDQKGQGV